MRGAVRNTYRSSILALGDITRLAPTCVFALNFLQQKMKKDGTFSSQAAVVVRAGEVKLADPGSFNAGVFQLMLNITQCLARQWSHAAPGVESLRVFMCGRRELGFCCHLCLSQNRSLLRMFILVFV